MMYFTKQWLGRNVVIMITTVIMQCSSVSSVSSSTKQTTNRTVGIVIIKMLAIIPSIFNLIFFLQLTSKIELTLWCLNKVTMSDLENSEPWNKTIFMRKKFLYRAILYFGISAEWFVQNGCGTNSYLKPSGRKMFGKFK